MYNPSGQLVDNDAGCLQRIDSRDQPEETEDLVYRRHQLLEAKHYDQNEHEEFWRDLEAHIRGEPLPSVQADAVKRNYESICSDPELAAMMGEPVTNSEQWIEKYGLAISFGPGFEPPPAKHLWYPSHLEAPYADEEWRKTAPPFFAKLTSLDAWVLEQQPIAENSDFFKTPPMPATILDLDPSYFALTDEPNCSSSCSSNSSGNDKLQQAQSRDLDYAETENAVTELCASCSRLSITHRRRNERNENNRIEDPVERLCTLCRQLAL